MNRESPGFNHGECQAIVNCLLQLCVWMYINVEQQAEAEQETIKVQAQTKLIEAEAEAQAKQIEAEAEAKANQTIANSITDSLLAKMEMEARLKHGWITVQGAPTVVKED